MNTSQIPCGRVKNRTTLTIRPGMVVRGLGSFAGTPLYPFREVASVTRPTPWAERHITFTDGTAVLWGNGGDFQVIRSKAQRNAAKARARQPQNQPVSGTAGAMQLLAGYAGAVLGVRLS